MPVKNKDQFAIVLGQRIRALRLNKNLSIAQLALDCGLDYTQLSRIELGKINTRIYTIYLLSNALDTPLEDLLENL